MNNRNKYFVLCYLLAFSAITNARDDEWTFGDVVRHV